MYNTLQRMRRRFSSLPSTAMETNEGKIFVPLPKKRIGLDLDMSRTDTETTETGSTFDDTANTTTRKSLTR